MRKIFFIISFMVFVLITLHSKAQTSPSQDPAWILQTSESEEFNSSINYNTKWFNQWPWGSGNFGAELSYSSNLIHNTLDTTLKIKLDTLIPGVFVGPIHWHNPDSVGGVTYVYQSGAIQSRQVGGVDVYKFGYFEAEAKYPTGYYPLWPAFWLWSSCNGGTFYNEIDIAENTATDAYDGHKIGTGFPMSIDSCNADYNFGKDIDVTPLLSSAFHKYAVEWTPDWIIWYFDDVPIRSYYNFNGDSIPQNAMAVIFDLAISPWLVELPPDWNGPGLGFGHWPIPFPQYFEINYFRYYKLDTRDCNVDITICTPGTDYSNRGVEKSISTGGSCSPTFNTSDSYTLRSSDFVLLDAGTTINPNSSGFFAVQILACPQ